VDVPDDAIAGKDVPALWEAGEYDKVIRHCQQDVQMTAKILRRLT